MLQPGRANHYVHSCAAEYSPCQHARLSRRLRQLRAGARERLGLPADLRPGAAAGHQRGGSAELSRSIFKPPASQGSADHPGTERCPVREDLRRDQAGSRDVESARTDSLIRGDSGANSRMKQPSQPPRPLAALQIYSIIFVAIFLLHAPLLRLPFFWDEAGYYVPAAYDLAHDHTLVPHTTLDTAHPPLPAAYLALWFTLGGWKPAVARVAMLLLAAFALTNVYLLARRLTRTGVAVATTIATALYPVFFVQSSLAHADLTAAAFTLWGIRLYVEQRVWPSQMAFCLAVLSKETAIITPLALALWELLQPQGESGPGRLARAARNLVPAAPLLLWLLYHHHVTGRFLGSAEFYRYNVTQALNPLRFLLALAQRTWHLLGGMNMLALTAATIAAMFFRPV